MNTKLKYNAIITGKQTPLVIHNNENPRRMATKNYSEKIIKTSTRTNAPSSIMVNQTYKHLTYCIIIIVPLFLLIICYVYLGIKHYQNRFLQKL